MITMLPKYLSLFLVLKTISFGGCHNDNDVFEPYHSDDATKFHTQFSTNFQDSHMFSHIDPGSIEEDIPIILWWTGRLFRGTGLKQLTCPSSVCYSTAERQFHHDPRTFGLYFYGTDLDPEDMPLPRKPHHEWAIYHEESPMNNYMLVHDTMLRLFNHTATFRRESDYPITTNALPSIGYIVERMPVSIQDKNKARKEGLAPVLFAQSHCDVASDRERYVEELMKYIKVDSIGACLHNKDIPEDLRDPVESMESLKFYDLIAKYKFHISFENAICKDYMTEKLFRPLHVGSVPVYRGSSLAKDWMPDDKSIIMADDFESPRDLAEFLKRLDENDEEYESYLSFKKRGIKNEFLKTHLEEREWGINEDGKTDSFIGFECYMCQKLTERYAYEKLHKSDPKIALLPPKMARSNHMSCPQPYPSIGDIDSLPASDSWKDQFWVEDYWGSLDKAAALSQMIDVKEDNPRTFMKYWRRITSETHAKNN